MLVDAPPGTGIRVSHSGLTHDLQPHSANHTPLMLALIEAAKNGGDVHACPYGCGDEDYDEHGYCPHLVGFSPGREIGYEPLVVCEDGKRRVRPRTQKRGKLTVTLWEKCRTDDLLRWIQDKGWARVYRADVPLPPREPFPDDADDGDGAPPTLEQVLAGLSPEKAAAIQEILTAPE